MRPNENEYAPYYHTYVGKVPDGDILTNFRHVHHETQELIDNLPEEKGDYRYAEGKWTVKEVLMHLIDTEQVMAYRALRIAREDKTPIPGFDQDLFAKSVDVSERTLESLAEQFATTRDMTHAMFRHFSPEAFERMGTASDNAISVRGLAYIIIGHEIHHRKVLIEKYL